MSGLNTFIEKAGLRLPTPIIDLITVNENSIDVKVSLRFNFVNSILDDASINGFIDEITSEPSPIYVYVMYVMDTGPIDNLVSGKNKDPLSELYPAVIPFFKNVTNEYTQNYAIINLDDFTKVEQVYSEETKNLIVTLSATSEIQNSYDLVGISNLMTLDDIMKKTDRTEVTVFAFTSTINFDSTDSEFGYSFIDESVYEKRKYDLPDAILEHMSSEISYENVYKDSELNVGTRSIFIDNEGAPYYLSPIKALDNKPYKQTGMGSPEIREVFKILTSNTTTEFEGLQEILNSIDLVTATEKDMPLLQSYEQIRIAFPEKSSVTEMGRFYELFKNRILGIDRQLKLTPALQEKLYKTPKIVDNRPVVIEENNIPEQDSGLTCLFANTTGDPEDEASWTNSIAIYEEVVGTDGVGTSDEIKLSSFARTGLCFLDFKLAMQEKAVILADFCSNDALELLFGTNVLNNYFKLINVSFNRRATSGTVTATYANSAQDYEVTNNKFPQLQAPALTEDGFINTNTTFFTNNYVQTRGVYNSDLNARVLVLQFQDWLDEITDEDNIPTTDFYELKITIEDTTSELRNLIISSFTKYFDEEFNEFYDYASEDCNYNAATGYFNDFFITGISNKYGTDSTKFPWLKMPMMLELYIRFISNNNEEDSVIKEKAEQQAALINPFNGTKDNLDLFKERCTKFIADYLIEITEEDTLIEHVVETIINPPKPVALLVGEGWDIPDEPEPEPEPEPEEDAVFEWVPFGSQVTYEYGRNYNHEDWDPENAQWKGESGELLKALWGEFAKHRDSKYSHLEDQGVNWDFYSFVLGIFGGINNYVEEWDRGTGTKTDKFFANSRNFSRFITQSGANMNAQDGYHSTYWNEGVVDPTDTTADTRLTVSVQRENPGLVTIDLAFWEVAQ